MNEEKEVVVKEDFGRAPRTDSPSASSKPRRNLGPSIESTKPNELTRDGKSSQANEDHRKSELLALPSKEQKRERFQGHFHDEDEYAEESQQPHAWVDCVTRLDVTQSKWYQDPGDPDREVVWLTSRETPLEAESTKVSFRWIHYKQDTEAMRFEDFEKILGKTNLYAEEAAVASKCLREAKLTRRICARGKYFEPTLQQAQGMFQKGGEKAPVKATFLSMPICALFNKSEESIEQSPYPTSRALRLSDQHPIRSLLQYTNTLAINDERDRRQVITRPDDNTNGDRPYIHVPEFWALTINMFTIITCAPFSVEDLCGTNIKVKTLDQAESRALVKYTSLRGTLHDLRCRTWFSLLDYISQIEVHRSDLKTLLNDTSSEYKIIDLKFCPIDNARWLDIVESASVASTLLNLRLVKLSEDNWFTLEYAQKQLQFCVRATWILLGSTVVLQNQEKRLATLRTEKADQQEVERLKARIKRTNKTLYEIERCRSRNRLLLYAARSSILDPRGKSRYLESIRVGRKFSGRGQKKQDEMKKDVKQAKHSFLQLSPDAQAPVSQVASKENQNASSSVQRRGSLSSRSNPPELPILSNGSHGSSIDTSQSPRPDIPQITINDEEPWNVIRASKSPSNELFSELPKSSNKPLRSFTFQPDIDLEAQRLSKHSTDPITASNTNVRHEFFHPASDHLFHFDIASRRNRRRSSFQRRHSIAGASTVSVPEILDASPPRFPLGSEDDGALLVPSRPNRSAKPLVELAGRPPVGQDETIQAVPQLNSTIREFASRTTEDVRNLNPFFEWKGTTRVSGNIEHAPQIHNATTVSGIRKLQVTDVETMACGPDVISGSAMEILANIDSLMDGDDYFSSTAFPVKSYHYRQVPCKKADHVIDLLQAEHDAVYGSASSLDIDEGVQKGIHEFLDAKIELFLSVHGLLRCFVHQDRQRATVIGKIWGIIHRMCEMSHKENDRLVYPNRHEIKFIRLAARETGKFFRDCRELLLNVRPEVGKDVTAVKYELPHYMLAAFRNIVLFLLSAMLAATEFGVESEDIYLARNKTNEGLRNSETSFLRMTKHVEVDDDRVGIGDESIRTADTLLALLLENAFDFSGREQAGQKPSFDLRFVYSNYTSLCITRAKREASARVYEDVRLLTEEITAISRVLDNQHDVFIVMMKARESSKQKLDIRLDRRILASLDEMIRHFKKLSEHASQAEYWVDYLLSTAKKDLANATLFQTRDSIEVRREDNGKAIYVFTAVTVIFLPLSFVTGLLGMNTRDVRGTHDTQWLFWVVAMPFSIFVLVVCFFIVQYKFKGRIPLRTVVTRPARAIRKLCGRAHCLRRGNI